MGIPQSVDVASPMGAVAEGLDPSSLDAIHEPEVALAVWRRELDPRLTAWLDAQTPERLPNARLAAPTPHASEAVEAACASLPDEPERAALIADIAALAERFAAVMAAPGLRIRLEAIDGNACRKFHKDAVAARLVCTYRGPATEWGYADRGAQPEEIHALGRGDAAICKGSAWRGAPDHRLLHRSPPIEGTGVSRLLLVLDQADPGEDAAWAAARRI
ncbi:MAG: DUF1826 domain-containing protein [Pseudomonadota bacterium]